MMSSSINQPRISWHRGGSEIAPSASLDAFVAAAQRGAELVEVDVRRSADGQLVCVHDDSLGTLGPVSLLNVGSLAESDRSSLFTLNEFCDALDREDHQRRTGVHLDLKDSGFELEAVDVLTSHRRTFFVTTLIESSVRTIRTQRPNVDAYLTIGSSRVGLNRWGTIKLRAGETFPMYRLKRCQASGLAVHFALATPILRWWCRRMGLAIVVWTVDKPARIETWLGRDIDVLTTNRPLFALSRREALSTNK